MRDIEFKIADFKSKMFNMPVEELGEAASGEETTEVSGSE